jgi:DNA polymerase III sliding clamp (beta) subunit (PCNA family)
MHRATGDLPDDLEQTKRALAATGVRALAKAHVESGIAKRAVALGGANRAKGDMIDARNAMGGLHRQAPTAAPTFKPEHTPRSHDHAHKIALRSSSTDGSRPHLNGVHFTPDGAHAVATDGHRLTTVPTRDVPEEWRGTVRRKDGTAAMEKGEHVSFPDYSQVIQKPEHVEDLDASHLDKVLKTAMGLASERTFGTHIVRKDGQMFLKVPHIPSHNDHVVPPGGLSVALGPSTSGGPDHEVAVSASYLQDAIKGAKGAVRLGLRSSALAPVSVEHQTGEHHTIMPMRI